MPSPFCLPEGLLEEIQTRKPLSVSTNGEQGKRVEREGAKHPRTLERFQSARFVTKQGHTESWEEARWREVEREKEKEHTMRERERVKRILEVKLSPQKGPLPPAGQGQIHRRIAKGALEVLKPQERKVGPLENLSDKKESEHPKTKISFPLLSMTSHKEKMEALTNQVVALQQAMAALQNQAQAQGQNQGQQTPRRVVKEFKGVKFEGDRGVRVEDFIYALENQFAMQGVVESDERIMVLTSGVVGMGAVWVREWRMTHPQGTYAQLKADVIARFEDKTRTERAYNKLMHMKQGERETIAEFNKDFAQTVLEVGVRPAEEFLLTCYKNTIKWDFAEHFVDNPPQNLSAVIARTEKREHKREIHKSQRGEKAVARAREAAKEGDAMDIRKVSCTYCKVGTRHCIVLEKEDHGGEKGKGSVLQMWKTRSYV